MVTLMGGGEIIHGGHMMIQDELVSSTTTAARPARTTLANVLQLVVGFNEELAKRACRQFQIMIDGKAYDDLDQPVELTIGSVIEIEGYGRINVIKAHFRTLEFYASYGSASLGEAL